MPKHGVEAMRNRKDQGGAVYPTPTLQARPPRGSSGKPALTANQVALRAAVDYAEAAKAWADMQPPPEFEAPAPWAVRGFERPLREAARRVGLLHQLAHHGGFATVSLAGGGGGGGTPRSPQERAAWAIGELRAVTAAVGSGRVRLDARGPGPLVIELLAAVCVRDVRLRAWLRERGFKPNGDRQAAATAALEAALGRVADRLGCA